MRGCAWVWDRGCYQIFLSLDTGYFCHLVSPGVDDDGTEGVDGDRGGDGAAGGQLVQVVTQRDRLQLRERVRPWSKIQFNSMKKIKFRI